MKTKTLLLLIASGVVIALGGYFIRTFKTQSEDLGAAEVVVEQQNKVIQRGIEDEKHTIKVRQRTASERVRAYCKWVHNVPYDVCVQTYIPVNRKSPY